MNCVLVKLTTNDDDDNLPTAILIEGWTAMERKLTLVSQEMAK